MTLILQIMGWVSYCFGANYSYLYLNIACCLEDNLAPYIVCCLFSYLIYWFFFYKKKNLPSVIEGNSFYVVR